jgi:hypothetical protein
MVYPALPGLENYLSNGGKLWMVGWRGIYGLMNQMGSFPYTFIPGDFPYDYLHLTASAESRSLDFLGAMGMVGYPDISADSMKLGLYWHGKMLNINTTIPRDAEAVLTFNSASGDTAFQGKPVGVRWLSGPYRMVFFGFPFYFMKDQEARQVAIKVLQDLGEPVGVEAGTPSPPLMTTLLPVYPNPCRGSARIEYCLAAKGRVQLSVYNVSGQRVRELVNGSQAPGRNSVSWDGRRESGSKVSAGVYFIRFEAGIYRLTEKVVFFR